MRRCWLAILMVFIAWDWAQGAEGNKAAGHGKAKPAVQEEGAAAAAPADKEAPAEKEALPAEKDADAAEPKPAAKEKAPAKGAAKPAAADAAAEAKPERVKEEFALDLDADEQALAEQVCPKLLELREQFDYLMAQYVESRRTLGFALRKRADKVEPKLRAEIEKARLELEKETERYSMPFEKAREALKKKEAVLIEKVDKAMEKNQNAEKAMADMKKVQDEIAKREKAADVIQEIGKPRLNMERWQYVVLYERIKPGEVEESYLLTILRKYPELTQARLDLDNYAAEIAALKEKGEGNGQGAAKLEKLEKGLAATAAQLKELYDTTAGAIKTDAETAKAEIAKLEPKAEQLRGKPQGAKAEQEIARLNTRVEGVEASLGMLKRFVSLEVKAAAKKPVAAPAKPKKAEAVAAKDEKKPDAAAAEAKDAKAEKPADQEKKAEAEEEKAEAAGEKKEPAAKPDKAVAADEGNAAEKDAEAGKADDKKKDEAAEAEQEAEKPKAKKGAAKPAKEE